MQIWSGARNFFLPFSSSDGRRLNPLDALFVAISNRPYPQRKAAFPKVVLLGVEIDRANGLTLHLARVRCHQSRDFRQLAFCKQRTRAGFTVRDFALSVLASSIDTSAQLHDGLPAWKRPLMEAS